MTKYCQVKLGFGQICPVNTISCKVRNIYGQFLPVILKDPKNMLEERKRHFLQVCMHEGKGSCCCLLSNVIHHQVFRKFKGGLLFVDVFVVVVTMLK